ncbi:deoxyribose-phosphate aldolase [Marinilabiliaceae bacterium N1Y90]|nr:deoxyribose-phosphate aldolase [Marinilabiliaceae bacterium N1Y90]
MDSAISSAIENSKKELTNVDALKLLFNCIDLTSLNTEDSADGIRDFVDKVNDLHKHYDMVPQVAAMCVYPVFAPVLKSALKAKGVNIAVVSAGFPSSQTFTDVKKIETERAVDFGANEIDIVISVGEFQEGNYEFAGEEIRMIKGVMKDAHLKVILESGTLKDMEEIWLASILSMESGADFIKTSTGKQQPAATYEAAYVMLNAIKAFHKRTGKKIGFKPAGGIATPEVAAVYYQLVKDILGEEWLNNELFRIGASRLANSLISEIQFLENGKKEEVKYF